MSSRKRFHRWVERGKELLHLPSRDASPAASGRNTPEITTSAHSGSIPAAVPARNTLNVSSPPAANEDIPSPRPEVNNKFGGSGMVWSGVKTLLAVLESSADAFGPLKAAVGGLNKCISIYEGASKGRKDYAELHEKLEAILVDLAGFIEQPMGIEMTNSVGRLCLDIKDELEKMEQMVEEKQKQNKVEQLAAALEVSDEILECYRRIHGHLERLNLNSSMHIMKTVNKLMEIMNKHTTETQLAKMSPAKAAVYNSAESDDLRRGRCAPGTREAQISLLLEWSRHPEKGRTCWMNGMAGTGKTTIASSVCNELEKTYELGASFFCSRSIPECRKIKYIIPSIAYQLAQFSAPFRCALVKVLEANWDAHDRALEIQYKKLIVEPLLEVQGTLPSDFIVVIDALDECENENGVGQILDLLLAQSTPLSIRFLLSSRPEPEIARRITGRTERQGDTLLVLHNLDANSVKADIETYMRHELAHISLTDAQWTRLVEQCGVLFIYASTTCRYIKQGDDMEALDEAVDTVLGSASVIIGDGDANVIDGLYSTILKVAFDASRTNMANRTKMKDVLETVICAREPVTLDVLAGLLGLKSSKQVDALLKPLRSVLNVAEATGLVTTLHASFPDFMLSPSRSVTFYCNPVARHLFLAKVCLETIDLAEPKFNICALPSSHLLDTEVEDLDDRVRHSISPRLVYTCRYWSTHLSLGEYHGELVDLVRGFFTARLLIWMEILNLTKNMRFGTSLIREAESWCQQRAVPEDLQKIAQDAREFVSVYANHPISQSTPHIYISMLPFWPASQPISAAYVPRMYGAVKPEGTAIAQQRSALLATWKVSDHSIYSMSLSADGARILAFDDGAPFMIDTSTGDRVFTLDEEDLMEVTKVALSPDGTRIVAYSGGKVYMTSLNTGTRNVTELIAESESEVSSILFSHDGSLIAFSSSSSAYIHRVQQGERGFGPLVGHTGDICTLAFSPNGLNLATGSKDTTIHIWNTQTGQLVGKPLEGHVHYILSISYSPDGSRLASGSADRTIRVWDPQTGQTIIGPLKGHSNWVTSVTFSPNGAYIASGSDDRTIRVYDAHTGQTVLGPLAALTHDVDRVIFSPDGAQLYSSSYDGTIRVWSVQGLDTSSSSRQPLPAELRQARYSPDGLRVVSGSSNGMVYVWDVKTGDLVLGPLEGHTSGIAAVDYSPDGAYIASASYDHTLRIWDAQDGKDLHGPMQGCTDYVPCVRFSPDSSIVASGSDDKTVRIWDVNSGQVTKTLQGHSSWVRSVAFSPNGSQLVSGSWDGTLRVWNPQTGETVAGPLQSDNDESIMSVDFSPDGSQVLSGSWGGHLRIWEVSTGQTYLICQQSPIYSVAFSPDGRLAVCGSNDGTISIWDVQSRQLVLGPLQGHIDAVESVQFSPDGSYVMSSSFDGAIRFWDVSSRRSDPQYTREQGESQPSINDTSDPWTLDESGWVVDRQKQKLVWVPDDLPICLLRHPNDSIICHRGSLKLRFDGANLGEEWTKCYVP